MDELGLVPLSKHGQNTILKNLPRIAARFRCRICWTNHHTIEEHQPPQLNASGRSLQIGTRFFFPPSSPRGKLLISIPHIKSGLVSLVSV